jgi:asparagine synthase (glutamine-hydrolysing)
VHSGTLEEKPYWTPSYAPGAPFTNETDAIAALRRTISSCVQQSLVSDVPVGLLLSAGMDSTIMLHEMSQVYPGRIKTFTVSYDEPSFDESAPARMMAQRYRTDHYEIRFSPVDVMGQIDTVIGHFDSLSANPVCLPFYFVAKLAASEVKVAVIGSGGDELFAGYETYIADRVAAQLRFLPSAAKRIILAAASHLPASTTYLGRDYKYRKFAEGLFFPPGKSHYWWRTIFTDQEKARLFSPGLASRIAGLDCYRYYERYIADAACLPGDIDRFLYADMRMFLGDNALTLVDMMSMAHSLEVRPPFLLPDMIDLALRLPLSMKMRGRRLKYCLRKAYARDLPAAIIDMPKRGFNAPLGMMINGPLKEWVMEILLSGTLRASGLFEEPFIRSLLREQIALRQDHSYKIWALVCFAQWYEIFGRPAL